MVHLPSIGKLASFAKADLLHFGGEHSPMLASSALSTLLARNIKALMDARPELNTQTKLGLAAGVDQRTVGRILNCEHAPTALQIEKLARAFGMEPWQMLLPQLDPSDPPMHVLLRSQNDAWQSLRIAAATIGRYRL